jgi:hypothetical protein
MPPLEFPGCIEGFEQQELSHFDLMSPGINVLAFARFPIDALVGMQRGDCNGYSDFNASRDESML